MSRPSLMRRVVAAWLLAALLLPAVGRAEEQPAILQAYGLDWIERVKEEAWPQPKAQRPVICLLDTGIDVTPDTPADDPNGPIVARLALDGGTGTSQGTGYPYDHGTQMASIIAAPRNGWGTVGVFPQGRIVSIRVTDGTEGFITPAAVRQGVARCVQYSREQRVPVRGLVMAESNYAQRAVDVESWVKAEEAVRAAGALFVAAVGNEADASTVAPLAIPQMLAVAAGDEEGAACTFVTGLDQGGALRGPGCARTGSWPAGSSAATAAVGALVAALATRNPESSAASIRERILTWGTRPGAGAQVLAAGGISSSFPVASPPSIPNAATVIAPEPPTNSADETPKLLLWKPAVKVRWSHGSLRVTARGRRAGQLVVEVIRGRVPIATIRGSSLKPLRVPMAKRPTTVIAWIESPDSGVWRSLSARSGVPK